MCDLDIVGKWIVEQEKELLESEIQCIKAQIKEAISILSTGSNYEKLHVVSILEEALKYGSSTETG